MNNTRRNAFLIMFNLIKLLKPLWKAMIIAVSTGVIGFILSFGITFLGAYAFLSIIPSTKEGLKNIFLGNFSTQTYFIGMGICGFFRAFLYYLEQYCNHYIAFHILAEIRVKLFKVMRNLAPAKMERENQGNIISMLTADIELLEVFYAHTISPILIAFFTSIFLFLYFWHLNIFYAIYMLIGQIFIGIIVPYFASISASKTGVETRNKLGTLNDSFLDKLRGIREIIQYSQGKEMAQKIENITISLGENQKDLRNKMAVVQMWVDSTIILVSGFQLILSLYLISKNIIVPEVAVLAGVLQVGTFAPYINLANLGNILSQTFACGERVLNLLGEKAQVKEDPNNFIVEDRNSQFSLGTHDLEFSYNNQNKILKNVNLKVKRGDLIGIMGPSGCGKSTLLKLIMRFWDPNFGKICINKKDIKDFSLKDLRSKFNYMTQSTSLFIGNIRDNLLIAKENASDEEIYEALKKASIYDYVMSLPQKLDSVVEEGGKNFSGGERQRIGLARSFLADRDFFLLDEPTSNLDILNEAVILSSLIRESKNKTIILVSHRESTLSICNKIFKMKNGKIIQN